MPQRPMDVGTLFDAALRFYRDNFVTLVGSGALITVPAALLATVVDAQLVASLASAAVTLLLPSIAVVVAQQLIEGREATIGSTWRLLLGRLGALLLTMVMVAAMVLGLLLVSVLGFVLLFVPGLVAVTVGLIFYVRWAFLMVVTAVEDERYGDALGRSSRLVAGSWWRVLGVLTLAVIAVNVAEITVTGAVLLLADEFNLTSSSYHQLVAVATAPVLVLLSPASAAVTTMLYYDQRVRTEGLDIAAALEAGDPLLPSPAAS